MTEIHEGVGPKSRALNALTAKLFPGGVSSPVRAFKGVGGEPPVIASSKGAILTDVDGRDYVDMIGAWGPMILGHGHTDALADVGREFPTSVSLVALGSVTAERAEVSFGRAIVRTPTPGVRGVLEALRTALPLQ